MTAQAKVAVSSRTSAVINEWDVPVYINYRKSQAISLSVAAGATSILVLQCRQYLSTVQISIMQSEKLC
jgi:hypothetical protein